MAKARRRRHVPAFGEWNYYSSSSPDEPEPPRNGGGAAADCWYVPDTETCSDVWFRYSPPARKPAPGKKARRPETGGGGVAVAVPAGKLHRDGGSKRSPAAAARARASDRGAVARAPAKGGAACRVGRPVDEDLYRVPPPDFTSRQPRRKRTLWMGCLGLNCVA